MGRGRSKLTVQSTATQTRGQKEYSNIAAHADALGATTHADITSLLASSFAKGLDCEIDTKIIDNLYSQINDGQITDPDHISSIKKTIDIFHEQQMTKQQLQKLQVSTKLELTTKINKKLAETNSPQEQERLKGMLANIDSILHQTLLQSNPQYARFF